MQRIVDFYRDERGGTALEYVILASMVAIFTLGALVVLGAVVTGRFDGLAPSVADAGG